MARPEQSSFNAGRRILLEAGAGAVLAVGGYAVGRSQETSSSSVKSLTPQEKEHLRKIKYTLEQVHGSIVYKDINGEKAGGPKATFWREYLKDTPKEKGSGDTFRLLIDPGEAGLIWVSSSQTKPDSKVGGLVVEPFETQGQPHIFDLVTYQGDDGAETDIVAYGFIPMARITDDYIPIMGRFFEVVCESNGIQSLTFIGERPINEHLPIRGNPQNGQASPE